MKYNVYVGCCSSFHSNNKIEMSKNITTYHTMPCHKRCVVPCVLKSFVYIPVPLLWICNICVCVKHAFVLMWFVVGLNWQHIEFLFFSSVCYSLMSPFSLLSFFMAWETIDHFEVRIMLAKSVSFAFISLCSEA